MTQDAARAPGSAGTLPGWQQMLVPVRGGPDAFARLRLALRIAAGTGAQLTAVYVMDERLLADPDAALVREELFQQLQEEGQTVLDAIAVLPEALGVRVTTRIDRGPVVETVLRVAEEIGADVIVVGAHRQTWLGRFLGGSVAESILRGARCAVLAVPPSNTSAASQGR